VAGGAIREKYAISERRPVGERKKGVEGQERKNLAFLDQKESPWKKNEWKRERNYLRIEKTVTQRERKGKEHRKGKTSRAGLAREN